jgi:hypothetical protein
MSGHLRHLNSARIQPRVTTSQQREDNNMTHNCNDLISVANKIRRELNQAFDRLAVADNAIDGASLETAVDLLDQIEINTSLINSIIAKEL